jgi:ComF family protein
MFATLRVSAASTAAVLRPLARSLADLVWPPRCAGCRDPADVEPFCPVCAGALLPVPSGCVRCGLPGPDAVCGACLAAPPAFAAVRAGGLFGGPLGDAIHALKYGDRPALARPLGAWLSGRVELPEGAAIVSIPLGRKRRIERGYDQAALLADELALASGRGGARPRGALLRIRETAPQVGRGREARLRNVRGAFWANGSVEGRELVLVDDVVTTGATADAAARALLDAGARRVTVVALARAE